MKKILVECAPMAGYTDLAFRRVLADHGAQVLWTEMVSVAALFYDNKKTKKLLEFDSGNQTDINGKSDPKNPPVKNVVQIFGHKPEHFKSAIEAGHFEGFDEININMGCPASKIIRNKEGSALMSFNKDTGAEPMFVQIIKTCVSAVRGLKTPVPVSVKMRLGLKSGFDYVSFAKECERAGAARLIVHGRTADMMYSGVADWKAIAEIVKNVKIPVIANGDIKTLGDAKRCIEQTSAHGVMVGRVLLQLYRKYLHTNIRILRGEKILKDGGIESPKPTATQFLSGDNSPIVCDHVCHNIRRLLVGVDPE
ncbi:MAG: tRNA-dihydrouridine synthase family protein [Firmicutes bacterium]|nr:tRNA-dihydrouridine synthase family protein [Bacillota bacterium]